VEKATWPVSLSAGWPVGGLNARGQRANRPTGQSRLIYPADSNSFTDCLAVCSYRFWSRTWVSRHIVPGISAASRRTDSARAWKRNGDVQFSAAAAGRGASASPLSCQTSTQARKDGFGFPRPERLTRSLELQTVIREGKRIRTVHLDVRILASPLGISRIGIVVPRHQHSAVDRNRLKRRLKELARVELLPSLRAAGPTDVAIRARREAYAAEFDALRTDVLSIAAQTGAHTAAHPSGRE
jgi:ribonuclease P protein component